MKVTKILYYWLLLLDQFRFCETHFTIYQQFVADQSAISTFLGGGVLAVWRHNNQKNKKIGVQFSTTTGHPRKKQEINSLHSLPGLLAVWRHNNPKTLKAAATHWPRV